MYKTSDFGGYGCYVDEVFDLPQYEDQYYIAPQVTTSGSILPEFVYNSVEYVQPNSQALCPGISVPYGGTTYFYYPDVVFVPVYYYVPVAFVYQEPIVYENPCLSEDHLDGIRCAWNDQPEEHGIYDSYDCGYLAEEKVGPAITSCFSYSENPEQLLDAPAINDRENASSPELKASTCRDTVEESSAFKKFCSTTEERRRILSGPSVGKKSFINRGVVRDPASYRKFCQFVQERIKKQGASSPELKASTCRDTVEESSAFKKFCSTTEERRRILSGPSVGKKSFINRGVVRDPASYRKFCQSVEERIKKQGASSPELKASTCRDTVEESSAFKKFCSTTEERRRILSGPSVGKKSFVNRGVVRDPASYRKFCQFVQERMKKQGSSENFQSFGDQDCIAKQGSKVDREERFVYEGSSQSFMDMILKSAEYFHVQDNLKNPKHYRDVLYKQALKKQNKAIIMEILPSIMEEPFNLADVTAECDELHVAKPRELDSNDEPVIIKTKQPKNRLKSFRKWWAKTFCCCCTTNQPP